MKKLLISAIAALTIGTASYAITAEEAIASKNIYVINSYCITNKINVFNFIFKSNTLEKLEYVDIYNSITGRYYLAHIFPAAYIETFRTGKNDVNTYNFAKSSLYSTDKLSFDSVYKMLNRARISWFSQNYNLMNFYAIELFPDFMKYSTNDMHKCEICLKYYSLTNDKKYLDMIDYNNLLSKKLYSCALDYAITINDIDKIIDVLLVINNINANQANAIIAPINSVEFDYRKADIVKALENINSRCTIKLYDDQKTWEPIIAKIRAMISIRK